jgi:hypothetical protein
MFRLILSPARAVCVISAFSLSVLILSPKFFVEFFIVFSKTAVDTDRRFKL